MSYSSGSDNAAVSDNTVNLKSGTVGGYVFGGLVQSFPGTGAATATDNSVSISGGSVGDYVYGGYAASFTGSATATGNRVSLSGGSVGGDVYGGSAVSNSGLGTVTTVTTVTASGNSVNISGGEVGGDVYGGEASGYGGSATTTATGNSVTVSGGEVGGDVYGGYAVSNSGSGMATSNTVTLSGAPTFSGSSSLYGGFFKNSGTAGDIFSGNALNVWNYSGTNTFADIANFEHFNFILPNTAQNGFIYLTTTDLTLGNGSGTDSQVSVGLMGGQNPALQDGARVTLLASANTTGAILTAAIDGKQGALLNYRFDVGMDGNGNNVVATVNGNPTVNPQAKALSEGRLAQLAFTNQGADLAAGPGLASALAASRLMEGKDGYGLAAFGTLSGGRSRYNTGSHVDVSGLSLMTGLSYGLDTTPGRGLTLGAFFEGGWGDYDTHNSFSNAASVKGSGDPDYLGGGLLGRFDFNDTGPGHFYAEATGRLGRAESDFASSDLRDSQNRRAEYDSSSRYYGLHLGAGYAWNINEKASLDLSGKYFWTRQEGDSVTLSTGDQVRFDAADSQRMRLGGRLTYTVNEYVSPYLGAAWEREFDGTAQASTYGYSIDAPDLKGSTGIGELGLSLKPSAALPLSFDLGVQGYAGKREGVTGSLQIKFEF